MPSFVRVSKAILGGDLRRSGFVLQVLLLGISPSFGPPSEDSLTRQRLPIYLGCRGVFGGERELFSYGDDPAIRDSVGASAICSISA